MLIDKVVRYATVIVFVVAIGAVVATQSTGLSQMFQRETAQTADVPSESSVSSLALLNEALLDENSELGKTYFTLFQTEQPLESSEQATDAGQDAATAPQPALPVAPDAESATTLDPMGQPANESTQSSPPATVDAQGSTQETTTQRPDASETTQQPTLESQTDTQRDATEQPSGDDAQPTTSAQETDERESADEQPSLDTEPAVDDGQPNENATVPQPAIAPDTVQELPSAGQPELVDAPIPEDGSNPSLPLPMPQMQTYPAPLGDWRSVNPDKTLSNTLRSHWVSLDADGSLSGRVSLLDSAGVSQPAAGLRAFFIDGNGMVAQAVTDSDGRFLVSGLPPGVYSLIATGDNGFMAFSLIVVPYAREVSIVDENGFISTQPVEASVHLDGAAVGPTFFTLKSLLRQYYPEMRPSQVQSEAIEAAIGNESESPNSAGLGELIGRATPNSDPATSIVGHRLKLSPDGSLIGRLHGIDRLTGRPILVRQMNVFVLQNDRVVTRASTDEQGVFEIVGLQSGVYGIVAAGMEGFGAIAVHVVDPAATTAIGDADEFFVSKLGGDDSTFAMGVLTDPRAIFLALGLGDPEAALCGNLMSMGGGGGGGGDLHGLGALVGAGLLAGALGGDDDDNIAASPILPGP